MEVITRGLSNPPFYVDKNYKAGLTGVTFLKEGQYKGRYPGCVLSARPNGNITRKEKKIIPARLKGASPYVLPGLPELPEDSQDGGKTYGMNKTKIRNRVLGMVNMLQRNSRVKKAELYFWTVTFKAGTTDEICSQLFNTWLTTLRQKKMLRSYLWVKERQQNGTVHYHILIPHFMKVAPANALMRQSICFLIRKGIITNWHLSAAKRYNGVDLQKSKKTKRVTNFAEGKRKKSLVNYITKYVTKNTVQSTTRCWHCSRDWSLLIVAVAMTRDELRPVAAGRLQIDTIARGDYADFCRWCYGHEPPTLCDHLAKINFEILHWHYGKPEKFFFSLN